ncbi:PREDICTED: uncharacterized protein LOC108446237 [Corvus brachyrhynchos]|uniref:uncharacterized protein LOC108446237 n=1 Tax=Corvus brachyrhynchos TaxID=85066 RepID=UPI0008167646|nr:PREDICTED: uncharacterized protein LOC108446237 [Corvus brachyrhynchos]
MLVVEAPCEVTQPPRGHTARLWWSVQAGAAGIGGFSSTCGLIMLWTRWAMASITLLAVQRALAVLVSLVILLSLIALLGPGAQLPIGESGPPAAMAARSGDPGAGSDSPRPYMAFDLFWELPAQGPNVSETSLAGLKNETGLGNISWLLMEQSELVTLLKETLPVLEPEPLDKEAPQEGHQAVAVPGGNSKALQPTGVDKRFSSTEDTKTDPNTVEGMANAGTVNAKITWRFIRAFLVSVFCSLIALLLLKVAPVWAKDIKERLTALRTNSELLNSETGDKELVVEV